jgi:hypothetical protein
MPRATTTLLLLFLSISSLALVYAEESASPACGEENCHGLPVKCGPQPIEACTMRYELGDRCRQYVHCTTVEGRCMAIEAEEFHKCKKCVEDCKKKDSPEDPTMVLNCEALCE